MSFRFIAVLIAASTIQAASFDCSKARTFDEMAPLYMTQLAANTRLLLTPQELKQIGSRG